MFQVVSEVNASEPCIFLELSFFALFRFTASCCDLNLARPLSRDNSHGQEPTLVGQR